MRFEKHSKQSTEIDKKIKKQKIVSSLVFHILGSKRKRRKICSNALIVSKTSALKTNSAMLARVAFQPIATHLLKEDL